MQLMALGRRGSCKPCHKLGLLSSPIGHQVARVVSAHASSFGDALLGVPLHCAAGLHGEAVALLQVCGRLLSTA
jgi:hypothetical protein